MSDTHTPGTSPAASSSGRSAPSAPRSALAACSGIEHSAGRRRPSSGAFGEGDTYTGPKVALAFWNGFTGGDGPFMKQMVEEFNKANPNVTVSMNTLQWADYYAKVPNAVASGAGPDVGIMHIDQLATNAARRVIIPLDEIAAGLELERGRLRPGGLERRHLQGQALRHPARHPPAGLLRQHRPADRRPASTTCRTDRAGFEAAVKALQEQGGVADPVLGDGHLAGPPDVHLAHRPVRRQHLRRRRAPRRPSTPMPACESLEWLRSFIDERRQPAERLQRRPGGGLPPAAQLPDLGRHLDDERVGEGQGPGVGRRRRCPTIGDKPAVWASSHNFVVTTQASQGPEQAGRRPGPSSPTSPSARSSGPSPGRSRPATACGSRRSSRR